MSRLLNHWKSNITSNTCTPSPSFSQLNKLTNMSYEDDIDVIFSDFGSTFCRFLFRHNYGFLLFIFFLLLLHLLLFITTLLILLCLFIFSFLIPWLFSFWKIKPPTPSEVTDYAGMSLIQKNAHSNLSRFSLWGYCSQYQAFTQLGMHTLAIHSFRYAYPQHSISEGTHGSPT